MFIMCSLQVTASWINHLGSRCVLKEGELQPSQVGVVTPYMGQVPKTSSDHQSKFVIDKRRTFSGLCGLLSRKGKRVALKKFSFENGFSPTMSYFEFHFFLICTMLLCCPFVLFAVSVLFPFVRSVCFLFPFFLSRSVSPFICVFCPCSLACSYVWYVQKRYFSRYSNWFHMRFWLNMIELFI